MCWHDEDGGFTDDNNIYGNDIDATKYDIRRKDREGMAAERECEENDRLEHVDSEEGNG